MGPHVVFEMGVSGLGGGGGGAMMQFDLPIPPAAPTNTSSHGASGGGRGGGGGGIRAIRGAAAGGRAGTGGAPPSGMHVHHGSIPLPMGLLGAARSGPAMMMGGPPAGISLPGMPGLMEIMSMLGGGMMFGGRPMGKPACAKSFIDALPGELIEGDR